MTIVFISNFLNHYQISFAEAVQRAGVKFWFVSCDDEVPSDRKELGFTSNFNDKPYLLYYAKDYEKIKELVDRSEIVISSYRGLDLIKERVSCGKYTFLVSERIFKTENNGFFDKIKQLLRLYKYKITLRDLIKKEELYYLLIGKYSIEDHIKIGVNPNRILKFAYFPSIGANLQRTYNKEKITLIWVGRLIDWKKPDYAIRAVRELYDEGFDISLKIIGTGGMESELKRNANGYPIEFLGGVPANEVRNLLSANDIMLFTSNYGEGWGCVLNEAMSEGCAVVASYMAGATPYLVQDGINGLVYDGSYDALKNRLRELLLHTDQISILGQNARSTINEVWNGDVAISNLLLQYNRIIERKELLKIDGPCGVYDSKPSS